MIAPWQDPVVTGILIALAGAFIIAPIVFESVRLAGKSSPSLHAELYRRYFSWLWLVPLLLAPILMGRLATIIGVTILSLFCYREFSRATGIFREHLLSLVVVGGICLLGFASADHWYNFFMAIPSLVVSLIVIVALLGDCPKGYIQRVGLAVLSFALFGVCLGHLGYLANDRGFQPLLISILLCVEMNDIFAFTCGKLFGKTKLCPSTSPNKTIGGAVGAFILTTFLFAFLGSFIFAGTTLDHPIHLLVMGGLLSFTGQLGDLVMSSVKRDLGVKDMGAVIPGHGGLLDRFDSLLFVGPALFHYIGYFNQNGIGLDMPARIWTGG